MSGLGKALLTAGVVLIVLGLLVLLAERLPGVPPLGRLPGDIRIKGERSTFYFPVTTCILLSVVLTLVLNVILRLFFRGR